MKATSIKRVRIVTVFSVSVLIKKDICTSLLRKGKKTEWLILEMAKVIRAGTCSCLVNTEINKVWGFTFGCFSGKSEYRFICWIFSRKSKYLSTLFIITMDCPFISTLCWIYWTLCNIHSVRISYTLFQFLYFSNINKCGNFGFYIRKLCVLQKVYWIDHSF